LTPARLDDELKRLVIDDGGDSIPTAVFQRAVTA
jgi:hypothetical protein